MTAALQQQPAVRREVSWLDLMAVVYTIDGSSMVRDVPAHIVQWPNVPPFDHCLFFAAPVGPRGLKFPLMSDAAVGDGRLR